jgi:hypothetical protein
MLYRDGGMTPLTLAKDLRHIGVKDLKGVDAGRFIEHYNTMCLHSAIGYITRCEDAIFAARDKKLEAAPPTRELQRQQSTAQVA